MFCGSAATWTGAQGACAAYDNYALTTINDASEQSWINSTAYSLSTYAWWWIGYNDRGSEGSFVWDGVDSSYTYWNSGQPDNAWGTEDCTHMYNGSGRWNDLQCSRNYWYSTPIYYICESTVD